MKVHLANDIARCSGGDCQLKADCRRFLAGPVPKEGRGVNFAGLPYRTLTKCDYHMSVNELQFTGVMGNVLNSANSEAARFRNETVDLEHLLLGLLKNGGSVAGDILKSKGVDVYKLMKSAESLAFGSDDVVFTLGKLPLTAQASKALDYAREEARELNCVMIGTESLLLGLLRSYGTVVSQLLHDAELSVDSVRAEFREIVAKRKSRE